VGGRGCKCGCMHVLGRACLVTVNVCDGKGGWGRYVCCYAHVLTVGFLKTLKTVRML